jgi:hypothetical protein
MTHWKLIRNEGPVEWDGKHSIFVDVVDEQGKRMVGVPVTCKWADGPDGSQTKPTEPKTGEPFAMDFPMWNAHGVYSVWVSVPGEPSDVASDMGLIPFHGHVCYKLVFQRSSGGSDVGDGPQVPDGDKYELFKNGVSVWKS